MKTYGCSSSEAVSANDGLPLLFAGSKSHRYAAQRVAAARRGIAWLFTFPEWARLWSESGRWGERGRGKGRYCMARHGDIGPYAPWNVSIVTTEVNNRQGIEIARPAIARRRTIDRSPTLGSGRGWTFCKGSYQVMVASKYVGLFRTQEEAEAAYANACDDHRRAHC